MKKQALGNSPPRATGRSPLLIEDPDDPGEEVKPKKAQEKKGDAE